MLSMFMKSTILPTLITMMLLASATPLYAQINITGDQIHIAGEKIVFLFSLSPNAANPPIVSIQGNTTEVYARGLWLGCNPDSANDCSGERPTSLTFSASQDISGFFYLD